jgi:hypothetical protein
LLFQRAYGQDLTVLNLDDRPLGPRDRPRPVRSLVALGAVCVVFTAIGSACRRSPAPPPPRLEAPNLAARPAAGPDPLLTGPHGGELIELGGPGSRYGIEMTVDRAAGALQVRVLQGVGEVAIAQTSITAVIEKPEALAGRTMALVPMMPLTIGSRVGSASLFRAHAPELRHAGDVSGRLAEITIDDSAFRDIPFVQLAVGGH